MKNIIDIICPGRDIHFDCTSGLGCGKCRSIKRIIQGLCVVRPVGTVSAEFRPGRINICIIRINSHYVFDRGLILFLGIIGQRIRLSVRGSLIGDILRRIARIGVFNIHGLGNAVRKAFGVIFRAFGSGRTLKRCILLCL